MSISYYDFNNLSRESQIELIVTTGRVIAESYKDKLKFVLYGVSTFTVEIVFNVDNDRIEGLTVFQTNGTYHNNI